MKIKDLKDEYPKIYNRALECQKEQCNEPNDEKIISRDSSQGNFNWDDTREGFDFWQCINIQHFDKAFKLFPRYREEEKQQTMKTKFMSLDEPKKEVKETTFNKYIDHNFEISPSNSKPTNYLNVLYLGHNLIYGDVFKAWDKDPECFMILFGEKGDEFNNQ